MRRVRTCTGSSRGPRAWRRSCWRPPADDRAATATGLPGRAARLGPLRGHVRRLRALDRHGSQEPGLEPPAAAPLHAGTSAHLRVLGSRGGLRGVLALAQGRNARERPGRAVDPGRRAAAGSRACSPWAIVPRRLFPSDRRRCAVPGRNLRRAVPLGPRLVGRPARRRPDRLPPLRPGLRVPDAGQQLGEPVPCVPDDVLPSARARHRS